MKKYEIKKIIDREKVWLKYDKHCSYCGKEIKFKDMQVDHLTAKRNETYYKIEEMRKYFEVQGSHIDSFENLMPSCRRCNHYKRAYSLEEFRMMIKTLHERLRKIYIVKVALDYGVIKVNDFNGKFYYEIIK